jgi:hypothetical protein
MALSAQVKTQTTTKSPFVNDVGLKSLTVVLIYISYKLQASILCSNYLTGLG